MYISSHIVHLSHIIDENIPLWPGDPAIEFTSIAEIADDGYYLRKFSLGEHTGTHINTPNSFYSHGKSIEQYPAPSLILPAIIVNICEQVTNNSDYLLSIADIANWEQEFGLIPPGSLTILYTGWQEKWLDKKGFFNEDQSGKMHFPGFGKDATEFLITERKIAGIGIDTHGVDGGLNNDFTINKLVLNHNLIVLENLTNLDQLPPKNITLFIGILRLSGGSGSPAAVMALFD